MFMLDGKFSPINPSSVASIDPFYRFQHTELSGVED